MEKLIPVILAGGSGSRLWPASRQQQPKQFIKLPDNLSLIQHTLKRSLEFTQTEILTVTNRDYFFMTKDAYEGVCPDSITQSFILEPFGRNSAAAIALAAAYIKKRHGKDSVMLVLTADHIIEDMNAFKSAVTSAYQLAHRQKLVTFGIQPKSPETGFGYIEADGNTVKKFVEKPDLQTAKNISNGNFYWNSGMFCMHACTLLSEMQATAPDIVEDMLTCHEGMEITQSSSIIQSEVPAKLFENVRSTSIDYAVFEKSKRVAVVPCDIDRSDVGSWKEFGSLMPEDEHGNHLYGQTLLEDTTDCIIHGHSKLITTIGLDNLIIADSEDAILIADKTKAQSVKNIVSELKKRNHPAATEFPTVDRPWGSYTTLVEGDGYKVKRIHVKPGGKLSLQSHKFRSEHWVVAQGHARVTNGDKILDMTPNQSTYIPVGNIHRLENTGNTTLVLIEVQCGSYLGEDDIIRYEDTYGRAVCNQ